jgi:hypothetical protein
MTARDLSRVCRVAVKAARQQSARWQQRGAGEIERDVVRSILQRGARDAAQQTRSADESVMFGADAARAGPARGEHHAVVAEARK